MKRIFIAFCLMCFTLITLTYANNLPVIGLKEGVNSIALSIVNNWEDDLSGMSVHIEKKSLPGWLVFQGVPGTLNVQTGTRSSDKLVLRFTVTGAPTGADKPRR